MSPVESRPVGSEDIEIPQRAISIMSDTCVNTRPVDPTRDDDPCPWLVCWTNIVNIATHHRYPEEFLRDFWNMERVTQDVEDTMEEGTEEANDKMMELMTLSRNLGLSKEGFF